MRFIFRSIHIINGSSSMVAEEVPEKEVDPICDHIDNKIETSS